MAKTRKKRTRKMKEAESLLGDTPTFFDSPESSSIAGASYDPLQQQMTVRFKHSMPYVYAGVSTALWIEFVQAPSKGKFFAAAIRPMFAGIAV